MMKWIWRAAALLSCCVMVGCDHATKLWAKTALEGRAPVPIVPGAIDLRYAENRDVGFNLLDRVPESLRFYLIVIVGVGAVLAMGVLWYRRRAAPLTVHASLALCIAGAVGNLTDRFFRGYVVDFVHVHRWPIFNVADVFIVAGIGLLLLTSSYRQKSRPPPNVDA